MKNESSQRPPITTANLSRPVLALPARRATNGSTGSKSSPTSDAARGRATGTQALFGSNGHMATVRFRASGARPQDNNP